VIKLSELSYKGNVGIMELVEFFKRSSPSQKRRFDSLVAAKRYEEAWKMVEKILGTTLEI